MAVPTLQLSAADAGELPPGAGVQLDTPSGEQLLEAILSNSTDLAYAFDLDLRWRYANRPLLAILGFSLEELRGRSLRCSGYPDELAARLEREMRQVIATGSPFRGEVTFPVGTSPEIEVHEYIYNPLFGPNSTVLGIVGTTRIITERRRIEEALRKSEAQLRLVTDHASVLLAQFDRDLRILYVNRPYAASWGMEPADIIGKSAWEVAGKSLVEGARDKIDQALGGERVEFEYQTGKPLKWMRITLTPERNARGEVTGFVAANTDITQRKLAEEEVARARDEALAASRAKDEFLAALSHELRMPLNLILLLASEAAADVSLDALIRERFDAIAKHTRLEARLIDDLLDLTRITRGKVSLDKVETDLHGVLRDAVDAVQAEFTHKHLELHLRFHAEQPAVIGDPARLQQIFWNLLKNASKFTPEGGRVVVSTRIPHESGIEVEVSDNGIGITADEMPRIFRPFEQGDHAGPGGSHRYGGLGLGLSISRKLVELHGGRIEAHSDGRGRGSLFRVNLPRAPKVSADPASTARNHTCPVTPASASPFARSGLPTILLVEDHEPTQRALSRLLTRRGYSVVSATTAAEARAAADQGHVDLVLSDLGLPDEDGCTLMADLRRRHNLRGIALTGYGMEEDAERTRAAGFTSHLIKPVSVEALEAALAGLTKEA